MKKTFKKAFAASAVFVSMAGTAFAGTDNITSNATTELKLRVYSGIVADPPTVQAKGNTVSWVWDLNGGNGTVLAQDGYLVPQFPAPFPQVNYQIWSDSSKGSKNLKVTHQGDGRYKVDYYFVAEYPFGGPRAFSTYSIVEITQEEDGSLIVQTVDSDNDGVPGHWIPPSISTPPLPMGPIEQEWCTYGQENCTW